MLNDQLLQYASETIDACKKKGMKIATAESCTGGLIAAYLTEIAGASAVFERGFITYSNEAKTEMLGVDAALIKKYGAVSKEVAQAMATGALACSQADMVVAVTGIAGPDGGSEEKPVGTVYIAAARRNDTTVEHHIFEGSRHAIRMDAAERALELFILFAGA